MTYFINHKHQERYLELVERGVVAETEGEVKTTLYLLSALDLSAGEFEQLFNLKERYIESFDEGDFELSAEEWIVIALAFNLFNGTIIDPAILSPHYALTWLNDPLKGVYLQALQMNIGIAS